MSTTKIEWTDVTWNPIIGCHKISRGCDHCYAERMANRISHMNNHAGEMYNKVITNGKWNGKTLFADHLLNYPSMLKKPKKIFVGSMTDIFLHSQSKQGRLDVIKLFSAMAMHPQHTFQILTKRPVAMKIFIDSMERINMKWPLPNVWLGVTVCDQDDANFRIPILLDTPAVCRFISIEPMLSKIDLTYMPLAGSDYIINGLTGIFTSPHNNMRFMGLDWVIVGGETGPGAREMKPEWAYQIQQQCETSSTPLFFKKWGSHKNTTSLDRIPSLIDTFKEFPG